MWLDIVLELVAGALDLLFHRPSRKKQRKSLGTQEEVPPERG
jgi:hypothetical protein